MAFTVTNFTVKLLNRPQKVRGFHNICSGKRRKFGQIIDHPAFKLHFVKTFFDKSFCGIWLLDFFFKGVSLLVLLPNGERICKLLSQFGITSSYDECLLFKGSAAYATMEHGHQKVSSTRENHMLIQGVADNFPNQLKLSPDELKQSLSMAGIMTLGTYFNCYARYRSWFYTS